MDVVPRIATHPKLKPPKKRILAAKAFVGAAVLIVSDAVIGPFGGGVTPVGLKEQVGASDGDGSTEQERDTFELNPPVEFTVTVDVAVCPAVTWFGVAAEAAREKSGAPNFTTNASPGYPAGPAKVVWKLPDVTGNSAEAVEPVA